MLILTGSSTWVHSSSCLDPVQSILLIASRISILNHGVVEVIFFLGKLQLFPISHRVTFTFLDLDLIWPEPTFPALFLFLWLSSALATLTFEHSWLHIQISSVSTHPGSVYVPEPLLKLHNLAEPKHVTTLSQRSQHLQLCYIFFPLKFVRV